MKKALRNLGQILVSKSFFNERVLNIKLRKRFLYLPLTSNHVSLVIFIFFVFNFPLSSRTERNHFNGVFRFVKLLIILDCPHSVTSIPCFPFNCSNTFSTVPIPTFSYFAKITSSFGNCPTVSIWSSFNCLRRLGLPVNSSTVNGILASSSVTTI